MKISNRTWKRLAALEAKMAKDKEEMRIGERMDTAAEEVLADASRNKEDIEEYIVEQLAKLSPKNFNNANTRDYTVPCAKRLKMPDEANCKNTHIPTVVEQQSAASSDYSGLACLLDVNPTKINDTSDEEEDATPYLNIYSEANNHFQGSRKRVIQTRNS